MSAPLGVGILGAGPVTQAIHLPTLARLGDRLRVTTIMDIDVEVATSVAARVGARAVGSLGELLADPEVDIVAICSPPQFHAAQVIAACRAGVKAVLCEKPFAVSREEAEQIAAVSRETGVPIIVGAMHTFDDGWLEAIDWAAKLGEEAISIRSSIVLPPNPRFEDWATEVVSRAPFTRGDLTDPKARAAAISGSVLGLAIHDLPLIRQFAPDFTSVDFATLLAPFGYHLTYRANGVQVQLSGFIRPIWEPEWTLDVIGATKSMRIEFSPSYVHAGSAVGTVRDSRGSHDFGPTANNGYVSEWIRVAEAAAGDLTRVPDIDAMIADLVYAVDIAASASAIVSKEAAA